MWGTLLRPIPASGMWMHVDLQSKALVYGLYAKMKGIWPGHDFGTSEVQGALQNLHLDES